MLILHLWRDIIMIIAQAGLKNYLPFLLGALAGLIAVAILCSKKNNNNFDERQLVARGDAFKCGFIAALSYIGVSEILTMLIGEWIETSTNLAFGIAIPALAFGLTCVLKNAYIGLKQNQKSVFIINFTLSILNIFTGLLNTSDNGWNFIVDGLLTIDVRLIIGFILFVLTLVLLITDNIAKKKEVDYEES